MVDGLHGLANSPYHTPRCRHSTDFVVLHRSILYDGFTAHSARAGSLPCCRNRHTLNCGVNLYGWPGGLRQQCNSVLEL